MQANQVCAIFLKDLFHMQGFPGIPLSLLLLKLDNVVWVVLVLVELVPCED